MPIIVAILAVPGCVGASVHGPADLFATANSIAHKMGRRDKQFETRILSLDAQQIFTSSGHLIVADGPMEAAIEADVVIVPGIGIASAEEISTILLDLKPVAMLLQACFDNGAIIAASCTGSFLVAESGLLHEKQATTTWWLEESFRERFDTVDLKADQILVDDDRVITSAAGSSYLDMALHLIQRFSGQSLARLCARYMVVDGGRKSQRAFAIPTHFKRRDELIERADAQIRIHEPGMIGVEKLAGQLGVSPRTLNRRIGRHLNMTSQTFIRQIKLDQAKTLLETTHDSIASIGAEIGYDDENAFRRSFTTYVGLSPTQYRANYKS
ncbi:MAG: helix-turn-helix domain-containing protein [Parvibaculaceae bacterium]